MSGNKCIVFGANGFLGSHLVKQLKDDSLFEVLPVGSIDLRRPNYPNTYFKPDFIFHCALSPNVFDQYLIDGSVLRWAQDTKASLITFGTDASYPAHSGSHIEENYMNGEPYADWKHYAYQKRALYNVLETINVKDQFPWQHYVLTSLFGPEHRFYDKHLMHDVIQKIVLTKHFHTNCGKSIKMGRPDFMREVVYVEDAVSNILSCIKSGTSHHLLNCGAPSKFMAIKNLVWACCEVIEFDFERIEFDFSPDSGPFSKWLDSTRMKTLLGDQFKDTPLKECIEKTADYCLGVELIKEHAVKWNKTSPEL